jgi:hypothetical protein
MIRNLRIILALLFFLNSWININAQSILSGIKYQIGGGAYLSGKTPFWIRANQYGLVPLEGPFVTIHGAASKEYDSTKTEFQKIKKFGIGYGAQLAINAGKQSQILLPEAYVKLRYGAFEFYAGRRKEIVGLIDTTLSAGSYIWSGNALPMPKIQISIPNYTSIIGHGLISIKGAYAHGWFGKQQYTEGYYLHQKWLYGKIGRDSWKFNFYGGINHQAQWGGYSETLKDDKYFTTEGYFSKDIFTYLNVALPFYWKIPPNKYNQYEIENRFGNHLGSLDLGLTIRIGTTELFFSRQVLYEDGQFPEIFLSMDGNYSFSIRIPPKECSIISISYLDTRRQAGELSQFARFLGKKETHAGEVQNYFNHGQYIDGWVYNSNGIGTPFIVSNKSLIVENQTKEYDFFSMDNRVQAYYISFAGQIGSWPYQFQSSFLRSIGRYGMIRIPELEQYSGLLAVNIPLKKLNLNSKVELAFDTGKIYGNNSGINFFIVKKW